MTDVVKLNGIIESKGVKLCKLGEAMNVSQPTLKRKLNGDTEFLQSEIARLRDFLSMTDDEVRDIFLR